MREDLLRQLELDYEEQREKNERTEQARKEEILRDHPEIAALTRERERLLSDTFREILAGRGNAEGLPERMEALSGKIRDQLVRAGYPADYLAPVYRCSRCRDTGYVGEPLREPCECMRRAYQTLLRKEIGLGQENRENFANFRIELFSEEKLPGKNYSQRWLMEKARDVCRKWADTWPEAGPRDLLLTGQSGLGKTFLLHCMAARLIERDQPVLMISAGDFFQIARRAYFENGGEEMAELLSVGVLMLDDLGSEPLMQNITVEQLFYLVNERQRRGLSTVVSTNLDLAEFRTRYTERVASRLTDAAHCVIIPLEGRDLREKRRMEP